MPASARLWQYPLFSAAEQLHPHRGNCSFWTPRDDETYFPALSWLWCAKIPSGSDLTEMLTLILFDFAAIKPEKPASPGRKHLSAGLTVCDPDSHVSIPSERKALTGFSA